MPRMPSSYKDLSERSKRRLASSFKYHKNRIQSSDESDNSRNSVNEFSVNNSSNGSAIHSPNSQLEALSSDNNVEDDMDWSDVDHASQGSQDSMTVENHLDDISNGDARSVESVSTDYSNEENEERFDQEVHDEPLYNGANITRVESYVAILTFILRFQLPDSCITELLTLIEMHCPQPNHCLKSLYFFRKFFETFKAPIIRSYYCSTCWKKVHTPTTECCADDKVNYFIELSLVEQLQTLFARPGFYNNLNYRFEREKHNIENSEDMYDGEIYQRFMSNNGLLSSQQGISFTWNSDGVSLFKSSNFQMWPMYLRINELSPLKRNKKENMILTGLWFGPGKPFTNLYAEILIDPMKKLYNGIEFYVRDLDEKATIKGVILCLTGDLPAVALFLNMQQYNGTYGCHVCKIKPVRVGRNTAVYTRTTDLQLRSSEETELFALRALEKKVPVYGVKGPTVLSTFVADLIPSTVIDAMHLILGISEKLCQIWFSSHLENNIGSLYEFREEVNNRLATLTPPSSFIQRMPRKIDNRAFWKTHEHFTWLLQYSTVILHDIMTEDYLNHHNLLIQGVHFLLQDSISANMISVAEKLLQKYVEQFKHLYGTEYISCNVHSLLHLGEIVRNFGPLWVTWCFPFESMNGTLKTLTNATRDPQLQISSTISLFLALDQIKSDKIRGDCPAKLFCERLEKKGTHRRKLYKIDKKTSILGKYEELNDIPAEIEQLIIQGRTEYTSIHRFKQLFKNGKVFSSISYNRSRKTNSSCVSYSIGDRQCIGMIQTFIRLVKCECGDSREHTCTENARSCAIIRRWHCTNIFQTSSPTTTLSFISKCVEVTRVPEMVDISDLKTPCFLIKNSNILYAILPVTQIRM